MIKRYALASAIVAVFWGLGLLVTFDYNEFGLWLSFGMSVGGVAFAMYNYLIWLEKLMNGEVTLDFMSMLNGTPH